MIIATGNSCYAKVWHNKDMDWKELATRLKEYTKTSETMAEYEAMNKTQQGKVKDTGGFIGGEISGKRRIAGAMLNRSAICLDADYAGLDFPEKVKKVGYKSIVYSTHSHRDNRPRYRWVLPLTESIDPDKYPAVARRLAHMVGIDLFDDTTYQVHRLMYWPSCSIDATPVFEDIKGVTLNAEDILLGYADWKDVSEWPMPQKASKQRVSAVKKAGDPREKTGAVGLFCRTYDIHTVIAKYLPEVYQPVSEDRYTYVGGSTSGGLVVYNDGLFAYSNHGTDPISGMNCNAFDLVRVHKFGARDSDSDESKPMNRRTSYKAMSDLARLDEDVNRTAIKEKSEEVKEDFKTEEWELKLARNKGLEVLPTLNNAVLILTMDSEITGVAYNEFSGRPEIIDTLPWSREDNTKGSQWRDVDDTFVLEHLNRRYAAFNMTTALQGLAIAMDGRAFHPVREYLRGLPDWDGVGRIDTLLREYLGAEETPLNKAMFRKWLVGAVSRVFEPGIKFDTMLVLKGDTGIGKSWLIKRLGCDWFTDSLGLADTKDKTGAEKIQGNWILEIGEMQGMNKADDDIVKSFLSRREDLYRASYGRRTQAHPRQCVFAGSTNKDQFLRDETGNRRYWPIEVGGEERKQKVSETNPPQEDIDQIWAEAMHYYHKGEPIFLSDDQEAELELIRDDCFEEDEYIEDVKEFISAHVPEDWNDWSIGERQEYWAKKDAKGQKLVARDGISVREIWAEMMGRIDIIPQLDAKRITKTIRRSKLVSNKPRLAKNRGSYGTLRIFQLKR